ncbi:MAG: hypothetical protein PVF33_05990 [Candidatus Latescibacterota bacterium]
MGWTGDRTRDGLETTATRDRFELGDKSVGEQSTVGPLGRPRTTGGLQVIA